MDMDMDVEAAGLTAPLVRRLGVDLGTRCGIAIWTEPGGTGAGRAGTGRPPSVEPAAALVEWDLAPGPGEGGGMRPLRFRRLLERLLDTGPPVVEVGYEAVMFSRTAAASHVYGELRGILMLVCEDRGIPYRGIPVATAKKHATGNHMAKKWEVADAMRVRFKGVCPDLDRRRRGLSENETDALSVLACVVDGVAPAVRHAPAVKRPRAKALPGRSRRAGVSAPDPSA